MSGGSRLGILWTCGGVLGAALAGILALGDDLRQSALPFLALYFGAFAVYAVALSVVRRGVLGRTAVSGILIAGALFRALLLPAEPSLSDDLYRYVWDGRVQAAGVNPYAHAPSSPALAALRDPDIHPRINHPHIPTIYPPAAEMVFAAARGPLGGVFGMKLIMVLFDLGTSLVLWRLLRRRGEERWVLAHAWSPLCIVEFAHSGHMDAIALFFLVVALERADAGRGLGAAVALGLSVGAKLFALALLPFFARRARTAWAIVPAVVAALYLPYAGAGTRLFQGLGAYAGSWRFNDSGFAVLEGALSAAFGERSWDVSGLGYQNRWHLDHVARRLGGSPYRLGRVLEAIEGRPAEVLREVSHRDARVGGEALAHFLAYAVALVLLGGLVVALWRRRVPLEPAVLAVLAAMLVLAAAVYPWYVTWLVPLAALCRSPAALAWSGTVALAYTVLLRPAGTPWEVPLGWRIAEYGIPLVLLALAWWRRLSLTRPQAAPYPPSK